jgi:DNA polymerase
MAKARAHALPGALDNLSSVLNLEHGKDPEGKRLIARFCVPRDPTKTNLKTRIRPGADPEGMARLYAYNDRDIVAEAEASSRCPDLSPTELAYWQDDWEINMRGVAVDREGVAACVAIIEQAYECYNAELRQVTGGAIEQASQVERLKGWLHGRGVHTDSLDEEGLDEVLKLPGLPGDCRRALEIRQLIGSAAVKKLYALANQMTTAGRVHDLFSYHSARTGRAAGNGPQPQNLPNSGPAVYGPSHDPAAFKCCGHWFGADRPGEVTCPWCGAQWPLDAKPQEWNADAAAEALTITATRSLPLVEMYFGNAVAAVAGCLRALFVAAPGHDLICSDYNAIEAVVLAALAGCQWRLDVFATHGKIYEASASAISGIPLADFLAYHKEHGAHHPLRKKLGKVAELASGYQGWIGAWKAFGADEYFTDDEIKSHILAWRAASPEIVEFWGGQHRGKPWQAGYRAEYFGVEGAAIQAVLHPGETFAYRDVSYFMRGDALYCRLPSGRLLTYHHPRLTVSSRAEDEYALSFEGWNTNPKMGPIGWQVIWTYGGKLTENIVQAVARDILYDAKLRLREAGYRVVLHVHDEVVCEQPEGWGSVEEVERLMMVRPWWAPTWPIKASGGWRGKRYRKD